MISGEFYKKSRPSSGEEDSTETISFSYGSHENKPRRKIAKVNDETVPKLSLLRNHLSTVVFSPDHLQILKEGPSLRRDFLDDLISSLRPQYIQTIKNYDEARKQRNELLKTESYDDLLMKQYNEKLIDFGKKIQSERSRFLPELQEEFQDHFSELPFRFDDEPELRYIPDINSPGRLGRVLHESESTDRERGFTTRGPHKDDWMVFVDDRPVDQFASRGELRILLLALKLAQSSVIIKCSNKVPILLFDDVESELDSEAQSRFVNLCDKHPSQVLLTGVGNLTKNADVNDSHVIELD